jgi:glycosyltransferase involved in cell wall biosynthesis
VSALVSTYNAERFIRGCLEDLVQQTLFQQGQLEIVVINSGSQEAEEAVVREFQARYPRMVYEKTLQRETLYAAWNRGIAMASGQYLTNANTDDRHRPDALERLARELDERNVGLVYGDSLATRHPNETFERNRAEWVLRWPDFSLRQFLLGHLCGAQPMWRRSAHEAVGLFDPQFIVAGDLDFFLRLTARFGGYHVREILGLYLKDVGLESRHAEACREETARVLRCHRTTTPLEAIYPWLRENPATAAARAAALLDFANALLSVPDPDRDLAELFCQQALELVPDQPAVLNNLAVLACQRGQREQARSRLAQAGDFPLARANLKTLTNQPDTLGALALAEIPHPVRQSLPPLVRPGSHWQPWESSEPDAAIRKDELRESLETSGSALKIGTPGTRPSEILEPGLQPCSDPPAISVVIPCYNQARYLAEAVESVTQQTFRDWEIIIVNDGSPDDTSAEARRLSAQFPGRITLLEKPNGGTSSARNAGIQAARAEYVFVLDADDRLSRKMLAATKAVLDAQPHVGFVYSDFQQFGESNGVCRLPEFDADRLVHAHNIVSTGSLLRKRMWAEVGGYNEAMRLGYEDWDFWISCVARGWQGHRISEPLFFYRVRPESRSTTALKNDLALRAQIVLNHPQLYSDATRRWAQAILSDQSASPPEAPGVPQEILLRQELTEHWRNEVVLLREQAERWRREVERLTPCWTEAMAEIQELKEWKAQAERRERRRWPNRLRRARDQVWESLTGRTRRQFRVQIDRPARWVATTPKLSLHGSLAAPADLPVQRLRAVVLGAFKRRVFEADLELADGRPGSGASGPGSTALNRFFVTIRLCRGANLVLLQARMDGRWVTLFHVAAWRALGRLPRPSRWLAQAVPRDEPPWPDDQPLVSLVVGDQTTAQALEELVRSLTFQTWRDFDLTVINAGSPTAETLRCLDALQAAGTPVWRQAMPELKAARVVAARSARGKYVCCLEGRGELAPTYLEQCVFRLEWEGLPCCGIPRPGPESQLSTAGLSPVEGSQDSAPRVTFNPTVFRRDLWQSVEDHEQLYKDLPDTRVGEFFPCPTLGVTAGAPDRRGWKVLGRRGGIRPAGKNLLVAMPFLAMGGAETIVGQILHSLAREGFQITVIATEDAPAQRGDSTPLFTRSTRDIFHLPKFLPAEAWPDFVFHLLKSRAVRLLWQIGSQFTYEQLPAIHRQFDRLKVADLLFNTACHTFHNRKFAHLIDLHCAESIEVRDWLLAEGELAERIALIPNGVDTDRLVPRDRAEARTQVAPHLQGKFVVGYFGRFSPEKAPDAFVRIAAHFQGDARFQFLMGGVGPEQPAVRALVRQLQLENQLTLLGMVDVQQWIPCCDVVVVPSRMDGRPNVILESFALGVPVIGSNVGGLPELIQDQEAGFVCAAEDLQGFADGIRRLHAAPELARRMGAQARKVAVEKFPIAQTCADYAARFTSLLAG